MDFLHQLLGGYKKPIDPNQATAPNIRPTFSFQGKTPGSRNEWQFIGGRTPVATPQVQLPQNVNPMVGWSRYGDARGNSWYENDQSGARIPIPKTPNAFDAPIPKQDPIRPGQAAGGQNRIPVQYINPQIQLQQQMRRRFI